MIILVRTFTHGGRAHRQRVSATFLIRKNSSLSYAPDGVRTSGHWNLECDALPTEPPSHPFFFSSFTGDSTGRPVATMNAPVFHVSLLVPYSLLRYVASSQKSSLSRWWFQQSKRVVPTVNSKTCFLHALKLIWKDKHIISLNLRKWCDWYCDSSW